MSTAELRFAAENGEAWAIEQLTARLLHKQARLMAKAKKLRKQGQGRVIPYKGRDAFFRCARAF